MLKYIDETDFIELLGVESIPSNFNELNIDASTFINKNTFGRIQEATEEVKYCTCKLIEILIEEKKVNPNLKSQSVDGWSETYADYDEKIFLKRKIDVLNQYLSPNLTYRGVNYGC